MSHLPPSASWRRGPASGDPPGYAHTEMGGTPPCAVTFGIAARSKIRRQATRRGRRYQAVAVVASEMPSASSQRSASIAALQPSAAAVTACR